MNYFIIYSTEDTALGIDGPLSKEEVLKRYQERYYGNIPVQDNVPDLGYYSGGGMMIICGDVVIPKAVNVVTKYEL
jgi:hypothetical protein